MNQSHRARPTGSDWVDVQVGTAARAIFTGPAIWWLGQETDRLHHPHGRLRRSMQTIPMPA